ncbi:hypothetical protein [Pontibacter anaerobius]|uniref:DUF4595 domain-containing protein n=1 Tax=Pontibacter anaerobius TaxID=2993940 RepID=A0ABT3RFV9_9BACT|nr:hypothetical protein [Pontibacter anaerobius]MCX2740726.1 hypothetical protein [Pontibacter anaerobius]
MKNIAMKPFQSMLLAGLCLSAVAFSSCDREDVIPAKPATGTPPPAKPTTPNTPPPTNTPPPVTNNSLLKQFDTRIYTYDTQSRLVELSYTNQADIGYKVVYEGDRPVRLDFKNGEYLLYTYKGDKVDKAVVYSTNNQKRLAFTFAYSGDKLVKETLVMTLGPGWEKTSISDFKYDANGNLTESVVFWWLSDSPDVMRGPSIVKWGNYDNKPNPSPHAEFFYYLPGVKMFNNNPGFRDPGINKELYTYTYHASGMPKQRTVQLENHPELPPYTESYTY